MSQSVHRFTLSACGLATCLLLSACGGGSATPEQIPPTVSISDNETAVTATGPILYTFMFSEDVGSSFTVDDIVITSGTAGTLTKITALKYTLLVTPTANATGTISVNVATAKFIDLNNNPNIQAASATRSFNTVATTVPVVPPIAPPVANPPAVGTLLLSFDETLPAISGLGAYGGALPDATAVLAGSSGNSLKIVKPAGPDTWGGIYFTAAKIPFTATRKTITARVNSTQPNAVINFKVEAAGGVNLEVAGTPTGAANTWSTVTWDFTGIDITAAYTTVAITPDVMRVTDGKIYYIDDITLAAETTATTVPGVSTGTLLASFDEISTLPFTGFNGAEGTTIEVPPSGGGSTGKALKVLRAGGEIYAGAFITTPAPIAFSNSNKTISARVYSPKAGIKINLKVEGPDIEVQASTPVVVGWQTLSWIFSAVNPSESHTRLVFLPDLGNVAPASGNAYFFDDVTLVGGSTSVVSPPVTVGGCTPAGAVVGTFVQFDNDCATLVGFGGVTAEVVADPTGGTNKVGKITKIATGTEQWAGATLAQLNINSTGTDNAGFNAVAPIGFTGTRQSMSLRVYSPATGIRVHLKIENASNGGLNSEVDAFTTTANAWETLYFYFGAGTNPVSPYQTSTHFLPNGPTTYNTSQPTSPLNIANTYNKATVFFDFGLGNGGYAAMPAARVYYFDDLKLAP